MYIITQEPLKDCIEEMKPLLAKHYEEVAFRKDKIAFNPDYDKYLSLDDLGLIHLVSVRKEGVLVGYYLSFLTFNPHYQDHLYAANDVLYVDEAHRGGTVAYRMFKYAEKSLKEYGVSVMSVHMKLKVPFDRLCLARDMEAVETIYMKYIGD